MSTTTKAEKNGTIIQSVSNGAKNFVDMSAPYRARIKLVGTASDCPPPGNKIATF
jgi:hypothetical protein